MFTIWEVLHERKNYDLTPRKTNPSSGLKNNSNENGLNQSLKR